MAKIKVTYEQAAELKDLLDAFIDIDAETSGCVISN